MFSGDQLDVDQVHSHLCQPVRDDPVDDDESGRPFRRQHGLDSPEIVLGDELSHRRNGQCVHETVRVLSPEGSHLDVNLDEQTKLCPIGAACPDGYRHCRETQVVDHGGSAAQQTADGETYV